MASTVSVKRKHWIIGNWILPACRRGRDIGNSLRSRAGFTLLELLVVIGILGILATITFGSYTNTQKNARDGRRKTDMEQLRQSLELYRSDNGYYPPSNGWTAMANLSGVLSGYIERMPTDPKVGSTTPYQYQATDLVGTQYYGYCIEAFLEASTPVSNPCTPQATYNYTVKNP